MASIAGPEIERLIQLLARMPGLGPRSARRAALSLVKKREQLLGPLADAMRVVHDTIVTCEECGSIDTVTPCNLCTLSEFHHRVGDLVGKTDFHLHAKCCIQCESLRCIELCCLN